MASEPREELIGAYLDDELSTEETARVEQWLAESAELRQLADELRALRSSMQALPRHQLDHDLGPAVLRRAERAVLGGAIERPIAGKIGPSESHAAWWLRGAGWRRLAWPAVVVAAALAIMIYDRQQRPSERQVASAPQGEMGIGAPAGAATSPSDTAARSGQNVTDSLKLPTASEQAVSTLAEKAEGQPRMLAEPLVERRGEAAAKPAPAPATGQETVIVIDVTAEFLHDRTFEQWLDGKKIIWLREGASDPASTKPVQTYLVQATPEQVQWILAEARKDSERVKKVPPEPPRPQAVAPTDPSTPGRVRFLLRARGPNSEPEDAKKP